jgi:site-specific DNA-cytosine methylase
MNIIHIFSGYNTFTEVANKMGHSVYSIDIKNYKKCPAQSELIDFLEWDFTKHTWHTIDFLLIGFPCTTFSKASGGYHFKNKKIPLTDAAHKSIKMIEKLKKVIEYFSRSLYIIENPTSALFDNYHFQKLFSADHNQIIRVHQYNYGHPTFKQTDLYTNINGIWLSNPVHRVNGRNVCPKFDNLTLKQRQSYPKEFCRAIIEFVELNKVESYV